jgi:hypothetical protein
LGGGGGGVGAALSSPRMGAVGPCETRCRSTLGRMGIPVFILDLGPSPHTGDDARSLCSPWLTPLLSVDSLSLRTCLYLDNNPRKRTRRRPCMGVLRWLETAGGAPQGAAVPGDGAAQPAPGGGLQPAPPRQQQQQQQQQQQPHKQQQQSQQEQQQQRQWFEEQEEPYTMISPVHVLLLGAGALGSGAHTNTGHSCRSAGQSFKSLQQCLHAPVIHTRAFFGALSKPYFCLGRSQWQCLVPSCIFTLHRRAGDCVPLLQEGPEAVSLV